MPSRKEQIHAALYNAAVDAGFMLYAGHNGVQNKVMVKDLIKDTYNDGIADFEVTFTGNDISNMDVHIDGVDNSKQISNSLI
jgi:fructose 1,6-bisphosphatase